jgi:hypothetical protein
MSEHAIAKDELEKIRQFEQRLLAMPQVDMETASLIHGEMYARTIFIPANTVLTGTLTNLDNICIVSGDISVTTDDGMRRLIGYHVLPANKGYKRVGYAHRDTYWTTIIHTKAEVVEVAEDEMTSESHLLQSRRIGIEFDWESKARSDYNAFVREFGLPLGFIDAVMRQTDDLIETDECYQNVFMAESKIHGVGLFANRTIAAGEKIAPARRDKKRCVAGRFTNHSHEPNAECQRLGADDHVDLIALEEIPAGSEITIDYRIAGKVTYAINMET